MIKKLVVAGVVGLACLWVAKKTHVVSYASTAYTMAKTHVHGEIPRELELARVQNEIQELDRDYRGLLGPIAEKMACVKQLEREINNAKANQDEQREALLNLTKAVENNVNTVSYRGGNYNAGQAKVKLAREFASFKKKEAHLASKEKLLDAEIKSLAATREQLDKLITQKREFEIRLAQLSAEEATLRVASMQTPLQTDESRVADIKRTLDMIEHGQTVEQQKHMLMQQYGTKIGDSVPTEQVGTVDLIEIRGYLQGTTTESNSKVVQNSK